MKISASTGERGAAHFKPLFLSIRNVSIMEVKISSLIQRDCK